MKKRDKGVKKKERAGLSDNRAVSPIIATILLIAIVVSLASLLGAYASGFWGKLTATTPQATLAIVRVDAGDGNFTIEHQGGDSFQLTDIKLVIKDLDDSQRDGLDPVITDTTDSTLSVLDTVAILGVAGGGISIEVNGDDKDEGTEEEPADIADVTSGEQFELIILYKPTGQIIADLKTTV